MFLSSSSSGSSQEEKDETQEGSNLHLIAAATILYEDNERVTRRTREIPIMTGIQWVELKMRDPKNFYDMFRMRRSVFLMLHETLVSNYGLKSSNSMSSKESLALFLWTCGSPQSNANGADRFEHSAWTISTKFSEVLECIFKLAGDIIKPKDPSFTHVHQRLRKRRFWPHFKNAIGAIDGTHIRVTVPAALKVVHINRHGYPSQNVMAMCDFDMRFTFICAGWPGSVHDTRVFLNSVVEYDNYPHPPEGNTSLYIIIYLLLLSLTVCNVHVIIIVGKYYLVDSGYPNRTGYLAPYKGQRYHVPEFQVSEPVGMQELFNHGHSSLRSVIERSFGCLKMKWRILEGIPSYPVIKQKKIVSACVALHNYIRDSALRDEHFEMFEGEEYVQDEVGGGGVDNAPSSQDDGTMGAVRDVIAASLLAAR